MSASVAPRRRSHGTTILVLVVLSRLLHEGCGRSTSRGYTTEDPNYPTAGAHGSVFWDEGGAQQRVGVNLTLISEQQGWELRRLSELEARVELEQLLAAERAQAARDWAPVVWLHSEETFFPGGVHEFLLNVETEGTELVTDGKTHMIYKKLPTGPWSAGLFLKADIDKECNNCPIAEFLLGKQPTERSIGAPVYTYIDTCNLDASLSHMLEEDRVNQRLQQTSDQQTQQTLPTGTAEQDLQTTDAVFDIGENLVTPQSPQKPYQKDLEKIKRLSKTKDPESSWSRSPNEENRLRESHDEDSNVHNSTGGDSLYPTDTGRTGNQYGGGSERLHHNFTVTYWYFYPYNKGKSVCTSNVWFVGRVMKPLYNGGCYGETITVGDHVGDWEHVSIYFESGKAKNLYISSHNFGVYYTRNTTNGHFNYVKSDVRSGLPVQVDYPEQIERVEGRFTFYSALGSHGMWPENGTHYYNRLLVPLADQADRGYKWNTEENLEIMDHSVSAIHQDISRQWMQFLGRWGNDKNLCHRGLLGFCELNHGPKGIPTKRKNFVCPKL